MSCRRSTPFEFLLGQRLVIEHKAVVLPHQALDLVAAAISEGIEGSEEWLVPELLLAQRRQAIDLFTKIDGRQVEIDLRHRQGRTQMTWAHYNCLMMAPNWLILPVCNPEMATQLGKVSVKSASVATAAGMVTLAKPARESAVSECGSSSFLRLPKSGAFWRGHSGNPNVDTMGFRVTISFSGKQVPIQGRLP